MRLRDDIADIPSLASDWQKIRVRSSMERRLLLEAAVWLGLARVAIVIISFRKLASLLGLVQRNSAAAPDQPLVTQPHEDASALSTKIGWAVRSVALRIPRQSTCLTQTLAGAAMLRRRGLPCSLSLGIVKDTDGIAAHAWLRFGDVVLTGANGHNRFTVISDFVSSRPARAGLPRGRRPIDSP